MSNDDREDGTGTMPDWTTPEYLANIAAEELGHALSMRGIAWSTCFGDDDGEVTVSFGELRDAETMLCLAIPGPTGPGTLYDRATSACVTMSELIRSGDDSDDDKVRAALDYGWVWMIHPDMSSHVVGWHVTATMSTSDANQVTARLNALPFADDTQ